MYVCLFGVCVCVFFVSLASPLCGGVCLGLQDMFYAAVEMRENPKLRGKPVAVGGIGMISTANYEARLYGVRAAMPGFIALKLCPHLVFAGHHRHMVLLPLHRVRGAACSVTDMIVATTASLVPSTKLSPSKPEKSFASTTPTSPR